MVLETALLVNVGVWLGNKLLDKGFDSVYEKIISKKFNSEFYKKVETASIKIQNIYPEALGGNVEYLFKREDVFKEVFNLLFVDSKLNIDLISVKIDNRALPNNFILNFMEILREELYGDPYFKDVLHNREIYLTTIGVHQNIENLVRQSELTEKFIVELKKTLEKRFKSAFSRKEFTLKYKERLIQNLSQVNFIGLGVDLTIKKGKRKDLEDLFVKPTFISDLNNVINLKLEEGSIKRNLKFHEIFRFTRNLIILGNPGSGKSMLTKFITIKLCKNKNNEFANEEICDFLPFRIELRKYFAFKKSKNQGILKFIRHQLENQLGFSNILLEDIESIIRSENCLIIFDGLDEIFDISDKITVRNDLENFSLEFPKTKLITTSRIIGYEDSALNEKESLRVTIGKFNYRQIKKYVNNWYKVEEEDSQIRINEVNDFLSKKDLVSNELISNPLLLSLIVILYRNNLKLPESKLEIYQSCTKTLVDKWDNSKGIDIDLSDEIYKRKDAIFADLAHWQYTEQSSDDVEITYQRAKNTIANSLLKRLKITDEFTADLYAEKFLEYAQKRSLYFDNNFTHKTFLEYYTAFWIFTNIEKKHKKNERDDLIAKYISNPYWHIVIELLLNLIDKDQADDDIMDQLIQFQLRNSEDSSEFLLQIFETLKNSSLTIFSEIYSIVLSKVLHFNETKEMQEGLGERKVLFKLLSHYLNNKYYYRSALSCCKESFNSTKGFSVKDKADQITLFLEFARVSKIEVKDEFLSIISTYEELDKYMSLKPFNFILNLFVDEEKFLDKTLFFFKQFVKKFGEEAIFCKNDSAFGYYTFAPFLLIVIKRILLHFEKELLLEFYHLLNELELVIDKLFNESLYLKLEKRELIHVYKKFGSLSDKRTRLLLIILTFNNVYIFSKSEINISVFLEYISNEKNRKEILHLYQLNNDERWDYIKNNIMSISK